MMTDEVAIVYKIQNNLEFSVKADSVSTCSRICLHIIFQ
jgi:hypothetical protein